MAQSTQSAGRRARWWWLVAGLLAVGVGLYWHFRAPPRFGDRESDFPSMDAYFKRENERARRLGARDYERRTGQKAPSPESYPEYPTNH